MTLLPTHPPLARALAERNFDRLTQVQTAVLADDAAGRDLLVSAQTGSGKTVAYGLAIAKNLLDGAERFERAAAPLALIVAPTRELALAGPSRTRLALSICRCARGFLRRRHGSAPRAARAGRGRPYRGRHAGAALRSFAARPSRRFGIEGDRARRGRRDARSRFSRGHGIHPRDHAGRPPHAAVLGDIAARHRRAGEGVSASRPFASKSRATRAAMPTSSTARSGSRPAMSSTRSSTFCDSSNRRARWCSATRAKPSGICRRRCWSAASPWSRCQAN